MLCDIFGPKWDNTIVTNLFILCSVLATEISNILITLNIHLNTKYTKGVQ